MTYIADLDAHEFHLGDEKVFSDFIDEGHAFAFYILFDRGWLTFKILIC